MIKKLLQVTVITIGLIGASYILYTTFVTQPGGDYEQAQEQVSFDESEILGRQPGPEDIAVTQYDGAALQAVVDTWVANSSAEYSVVVYDPQSKTMLASHNPDQLYFSASLYKLYFAYLAWQDIKQGSLEPSQAMVQTYTLQDCLDRMVRLSDSPCGEAVLGLYNYQEAQTRLRELGLPNINMPGFEVSASDMNVLLDLIYNVEGIDSQAAESMRLSMQNQVYDAGLKAGFSKLVVQDKVGFSENGDWHDSAIVSGTKGDVLVTVLSKGAGRSGVSGLASSLQELL